VDNLVQVQSGVSKGFTVFSEITELRVVAQASIYTCVAGKGPDGRDAYATSCERPDEIMRRASEAGVPVTPHVDETQGHFYTQDEIQAMAAEAAVGSKGVTP
jgi:hypothetical protein